MEAGADGVAEGPAAVGEDVVEGMVVDEVHLGADADVFAEGEIAAPAESVEAGPVELESCGGELVLALTRLERIGGMRHGSLAQGAQGWADEQSQPGVVAVGELRTAGKCFREGIRRHCEMVGRRQKAERDVAGLRGVDLGLQGRGQEVGGEKLRAPTGAVVAAEGEPAPRVHPGVNMEAVLVEAERGAIDVGEARVNVVAADVSLLRVGWDWDEGEEDCQSGDYGETKAYDSQLVGPSETGLDRCGKRNGRSVPASTRGNITGTNQRLSSEDCLRAGRACPIHGEARRMEE